MRFWELLGRAAYWGSWPISYVHLQNSVRARVLVQAEDKILLVKNWHGTGAWTLPGGGVHRGEAPVRAATRELMEETGVALGIDQLQQVSRSVVKENGLNYTGVYFVASLQKPLPLRPQFPEILQAEWVALSRLSGRSVASEVHAVLSKRA